MTSKPHLGSHSSDYIIPIIAGPTASGKTSLARALARRIRSSTDWQGCEAVSADSRQIYRRLDIGTAKPDAEELAELPHHLIDFVEPTESYSAGKFRDDAEAAIADCLRRNVLPIVVGGTGFYLRSLTEGLSPIPPVDETAHCRLVEEAQELGSEKLHARLVEIDPAAAEGIRTNDPQRIIRALSVWETTGRTLSDWWNEEPPPPKYRYRWLGLRWDRTVLRERIRARTDEMIRAGLEDEVRGLLDDGLTWDDNALRSVGYREWQPYFEGQVTREEVIERIVIHSAQYAKRQMTWFNSVEAIEWLDAAADDTVENAERWLRSTVAGHLP